MTEWAWDLTGHEATRHAAVVTATTEADLERADHDQADADRKLMAGLNPEQQRIRDILTDAGVLPK